MSEPVTIAEGHTLTLTEQPVEAGPRFTVVCTCGERFTSDYAVCAQVVPTIHRYDFFGGTMTDNHVVPGEVLIRGHARIDWIDIGEGLTGGYDPNDPEDVELLRFSVYRFDGDDALLAAALADPELGLMLDVEGRGWVEVDDASYCTNVPANTDTAERQRLLVLLMDEFHQAVTERRSVKKLGEAASHIGPGDQVLAASPYLNPKGHRL